MKFRMVVADVDGTLIKPTGQKAEKASERLIKAVEAVRKAGAVFTMASARSYDWVEELVKSLKIDSPIILDNGARIFDCLVEKYISQVFIPNKKVNEVLNFLEQLPYNKYLVDANGRHTYYADQKLEFKDVVKIMILHIPPLDAQEVYEELLSLKGLSITKSVSGENPPKESIHITHKDAAKEKGLKKIADLLGINYAEIMAIGDSYNDFSLLTASGFKVAMGNAIPEIKAIADYIAPSVDDEGVAQVLEKFFINK